MVLGTGFLGILLGGYVLGWDWTGFTEPEIRRLWDWLELFIVPIVLAVGGYFFTRSESRATQASAERRAQDEALQSYLDQMGELLLDRKLRALKEGKEARTLARARTVTVFKRLDAQHNRSVLHFLRDSQLVGDPENPIVSFSHADLSYADLRGADLRGADLRGAFLRHANLEGTRLQDAWIRDPKWRLVEAPRLESADLRGAVLTGAEGITQEELERQAKSLEGATMPDGWVHD